MRATTVILPLIPLLTAAFLAQTAIPSALAQTPASTPRFTFSEVFEPPSDYVAGLGRGHFEAQAMNAQGYVTFRFIADREDQGSRRTPLVYVGEGRPYVTLQWPGDLDPAPGGAPSVNAISDLAEDGSFWVAGTYVYDIGLDTRGVAWKVMPDGSSTVYGLRNRIHPTLGFEERDGWAIAINSRGVAVGTGHRTSELGNVVSITGLRWELPSTTAIDLSSAEIRLGGANDVDEEGNFISLGSNDDLSYVGAYYNYSPFPTVTRREMDVLALNNGRIVGRYEFDDSEVSGPFVYKLGESLVRLPRPRGSAGDAYTGPEITGDSGKHLNARGDIIGSSSNPPSEGNAFNRSFQVLWKLQPDGRYEVFTLRALLEPIPGTAGSEFWTSQLLGISDDGTLLLQYTLWPGILQSRLLLPVTSTFASWAAQFGLDETDLLGDPDRDGLTNLVEYGLAKNPLSPSTDGVTVKVAPHPFIPDTPFLTISYTRPRGAKMRSDLSYTIEGSSGGAWARVDEFATPEVTPIDGDLELVTYISLLPAGGESGTAREFLRVGITLAAP